MNKPTATIFLIAILCVAMFTMLLLSAKAQTTVNPAISSVSFSLTANGYTVMINGNGFGTLPNSLPYFGDTSFLRIEDASQVGHAEWGYSGDYQELDYTLWTDSQIVVSAFGAVAGDAAVIALWNPSTGLGATWGGNVGVASYSAPQISSVSFSGSGKNLEITILGSGFGNTPVTMPFTGDLNYLKFEDFRQHGSGSALFAAGCQEWGISSPNAVTMVFTSWSNNQIQISGFADAYGQNGATLQTGDPVNIILWNTQDTHDTGPQTAWGGTVNSGTNPKYFSIFWITDTQFLSEPENSQGFNDLTNWIVSNKDVYNLQMVVHTGDIVQDGGGIETLPNLGNLLPEWSDANAAMSTLMSNGIPYCWNAGNHDYHITLDNKNIYAGNAYSAFDPSTVSKAEPSNWVSSTPDGENTAVKINYMNRNFLIVNIEWNAPDSVFTTWVDPLLSTYSNYQIIIATHAYMDQKGNYAYNSVSDPKPDKSFYNDLESRIESHPNIFLTLNGHFDTPQGYAQIESPTRLMFDSQGQPEATGAESVTILTFYLDTNTIHAKTYRLTQGLLPGPFKPYNSQILTFPLPSVSSTSISNGAASIDNTATTNVKIDIRGSSASDGTSLTIATTDFGSIVPSIANVGKLQLNGVVYYDARVQGISDGTATITISQKSGQVIMQYWDGTQWVSASNIIVSGNTIAGNIPVEDLTGTPIALGTKQNSVTPEFPLGAILVILVCFVTFVAFAAFKKGRIEPKLLRNN